MRGDGDVGARAWARCGDDRLVGADDRTRRCRLLGFVVQLGRLGGVDPASELVAGDLSTVPLLQGAQVAVTGKDVSGVTLDASFKLRFAPITK